MTKKVINFGGKNKVHPQRKWWLRLCSDIAIRFSDSDFPRERAITWRSDDVFMQWPWPLTFWPWTYIECLVVELCIKFERNQTMRGGVIDASARCRRTILEVQFRWGQFSSVRVQNCIRFGEDIASLKTLNTFVLGFRYVFQNQTSLKTKFCTVYPSTL